MAHLLAERIITSAVGNRFLIQAEAFRGGYRIHGEWIQRSGYQIKDHLTADGIVG
jgi:allophanate hydrolase subunit 2